MKSNMARISPPKISVLLGQLALCVAKREISEPFKTKITVKIIVSCVNNFTKTTRHLLTYISKSADADY